MSKLVQLENMEKSEQYFVYINKELCARFVAVIYYKNSLEVLTKIVLENKIPEYNIDKMRLSELLTEYGNTLNAIDTLFKEALIEEFGQDYIAIGTDRKYHLEVNTDQQLVVIEKVA